MNVYKKKKNQLFYYLKIIKLKKLIIKGNKFTIKKTNHFQTTEIFQKKKNEKNSLFDGQDQWLNNLKKLYWVI